MQTEGLPSWAGVPLKYISLVTLTIQNSALILIMHYSRVMPGYSDKRYMASTAVLLNEVLKLAICVPLNWRDQKRTLGEEYTFMRACRATFTRDAWKLTIPAVLYTVSITGRASTLPQMGTDETRSRTICNTSQCQTWTLPPSK